MKRHTKKSVVWLIIISMLVLTMQTITLMAEPLYTSVNVGDYINYGTYGKKDVLWRVVENNEKGVLVWQDKILEYRAYDESNKNTYESSKIRAYLNDEKGFLGHFSPIEKLLMKMQDGIGDKIFLPTIEQLESIKKNGIQLGEDYYYKNKGGSYWLGSVYGNTAEVENPKVSIVSSEGSVLGEDANNVSIGVLPAFYLDREYVIFKSGKGTEGQPYTLYTQWKGTPEIKAQGAQVVLSNVEVIGEEDLAMLMPVIQVDSSVQNVKHIKYDGANKTMTYTLENPIKQNQVVKFQYKLPVDATSAIAKVGERAVLKELVVDNVINETIDHIAQPIEIINDLKNEEMKVGENRILTVTAKGEGELTFKWFKNNELIKTEIKQSFNQGVQSSYEMNPVKLEDAGIYRVQISGLTEEKNTTCEVKVRTNEYTVTRDVSPTRGGSTGDDSQLGNGRYIENSIATITANPSYNYRFINWTENNQEVSRDKNYTFKVTGNRKLVANFKWDEPVYIPQYTLYVTENPLEGGTVTGDYTYNEGDYATLKARAKEGYVFESWTENGRVVSTETEYGFTVRKDRWLRANFEKEKPKEKTFKEEWRSLTSRQVQGIKDNFEEYLPYTTLDETLEIEQLDKLTNGCFTKKQLKEVAKDMALLEDRGVSLDWELIKLKKVNQVSFKDLSRSHWAYGNITELAKRGMVAGYKDQTFKPSQPLTTADTFTFLDRMLLTKDRTEVKLPRSTVERFIESKNNWAFAHMASIGSKLSKETLDIVEKTGNQSVSRELLAQVLYEVTGGDLKKTKPLVVFTDTLYSPYEKAIAYCVRTGLLEGTSSYTMSPKKSVTRAEMMTILQRLDNLLK